MRTDEMLKVQEAHDKLKAENERLRTRLAALEAVVASDFAKGSRTGLQYCIGECIKPQVCDVLADKAMNLTSAQGDT